MSNIDKTTVRYIARGPFGEELGRRAVCLIGVKPPAEEGVRWEEDKTSNPTFLTANAAKKLQKNGWITVPS